MSSTFDPRAAIGHDDGEDDQIREFRRSDVSRETTTVDRCREDPDFVESDRPFNTDLVRSTLQRQRELLEEREIAERVRAKFDSGIAAVDQRTEKIIAYEQNKHELSVALRDTEYEPEATILVRCNES